jgi:hypothetical protein
MLTLTAFLCAAACGENTPTTPAGVEFIAAGSLSGDLTDRSGLSGNMPRTEIPQNRLGAVGSALAYTGSGNLYLAQSDRGPDDGGAGFLPRFHTLAIDVDLAGRALILELKATTLFTQENGEHYTGLASRFDPKNDRASARLDLEGARVSRQGTLFTSEEYGPWIDEWTPQGRHLRRISPPAKFLVAQAGELAELELPPYNRFGRQSNRALEGLAIGVDGDKLYAAMQSPLIQDGGLNEKNKRVGVNLRLLEWKLQDGASREFVYVLEDPSHGVNEILAAGPETFLVLERDSLAGKDARFKRIYKVELGKASDVSQVDSLPTRGLPQGITPVAKELFLDFLDPRFGLAGKRFAEKLESLAFGPDLPDGRRLLMVGIDNDFNEPEPNLFLAFAVEPKLLPAWRPLVLDVPWKP